MIILTVIAVLALGWAASESKRASKYLEQRDNLLTLLDSEGRGKEALEVMGK